MTFVLFVYLRRGVLFGVLCLSPGNARSKMRYLVTYETLPGLI